MGGSARSLTLELFMLYEVPPLGDRLPDPLPFTPLNELRRQLVYAHNGSAVVMTMVGGKVVMRVGRR